MDIREVNDTELEFLQRIMTVLDTRGRYATGAHDIANTLWQQGCTQDDIERVGNGLNKLQDLRFVRPLKQHGDLPIDYELVERPNMHESLLWFKKQAIIEEEKAKKQIKTDRLNRNATRISSSAAVIAVTFAIFQWYDSRNSRSDVQELKTRLEAVEHSVSRILLDASLSTTIPSSPPKNSSTYQFDTLEIQDTVKPK